MFPYIVLAWIGTLIFAFSQGYGYCNDQTLVKQLKAENTKLKIDRIRFQKANEEALKLNEQNEVIKRKNEAIIDELREEIENRPEPKITNNCGVVFSKEWLRRLDKLQ